VRRKSIKLISMHIADDADDADDAVMKAIMMNPQPYAHRNDNTNAPTCLHKGRNPRI
jgi:hypothetical protein